MTFPRSMEVFRVGAEMRGQIVINRIIKRNVVGLVGKKSGAGVQSIAPSLNALSLTTFSSSPDRVPTRETLPIFKVLLDQCFLIMLLGPWTI